MRRRPATFLSLTVVAVVLAAASCGEEPRESVSPPPIAAAKSSPEPVQPQAAPPSPAASESAPATPAPAPMPRSPQGQAQPIPTARVSSAPGAIPPSVLPDPSATPAEKPVDPVKWLQDRQARQYDYQRRVEATQAEVDAAGQDAANWDRVALQFKNPFLPRPQLSPEDQAAIQGMSNPDRVRWAEDRAAAAKVRLADAQKKLDDLRANPAPN